MAVLEDWLISGHPPESTSEIADLLDNFSVISSSLAGNSEAVSDATD